MNLNSIDHRVALQRQYCEETGRTPEDFDPVHYVMWLEDKLLPVVPVCTCDYPLIRGVSPEYCGDCGGDLTDDL